VHDAALSTGSRRCEPLLVSAEYIVTGAIFSDDSPQFRPVVPSRSFPIPESGGWPSSGSPIIDSLVGSGQSSRYIDELADILKR
jgi:hypothetical protein